MVKRFLFRWLINFFGLWAAASLLVGRISYGNRLSVLLIAALIFSVVNALIKPLVILLTLPAIVITLGLFTLVINVGMLYLVTLVYPRFTITSFWAALGAVIVIWLVNYLMNELLEPTPAPVHPRSHVHSHSHDHSHDEEDE